MEALDSSPFKLTERRIAQLTLLIGALAAVCAALFPRFAWERGFWWARWSPGSVFAGLNPPSTAWYAPQPPAPVHRHRAHRLAQF